MRALEPRVCVCVASVHRYGSGDGLGSQGHRDPISGQTTWDRRLSGPVYCTLYTGAVCVCVASIHRDGPGDGLGSQGHRDPISRQRRTGRRFHAQEATETQVPL